MANAASTRYDIAMQYCSGAIPKAKVVIAALCGQKAHVHSALRVHMEQVDILVGEEAQQDMDLKSAFVPAIPRQPFLRLLFGDPKQSPGGVADNLREHRALLLKAPIGLLAAHRWYMPHDLPAVLCNLLHSSAEVFSTCCQKLQRKLVVAVLESVVHRTAVPQLLTGRSSITSSPQRHWQS